MNGLREQNEEYACENGLAIVRRVQYCVHLGKGVSLDYLAFALYSGYVGTRRRESAYPPRSLDRVAVRRTNR